MGQEVTKQEQNPFVQKFDSNFTLYKGNYEDVRLGNISIYSKGQEYVAVKKTFSNSKEALEEFVKEKYNLQFSKYTQCPYILKFLGYKAQNQQALCGTTTEALTYHEYYLNNLDLEINQRAQTQMFYTETDLWIILYSIISALAFLEPLQGCINDIRPSTTFIAPSGQIKMFPFGIFPDDLPAYNKALNFNQKCFLAPEQMEEFKKDYIKSNQDQSKADIYQLGMTLLQCSTLQDLTLAYDYEQRIINQQVIDDFILVARQRYSKFYCNMIKTFLNQDPTQRPSATQISQILYPYSTSIMNGIPFQPNQQQITDIYQKSQGTTTIFSQNIVQPIQTIPMQAQNEIIISQEPMKKVTYASQIPQQISNQGFLYSSPSKITQTIAQQQVVPIQNIEYISPKQEDAKLIQQQQQIQPLKQYSINELKLQQHPQPTPIYQIPSTTIQQPQTIQTSIATTEQFKGQQYVSQQPNIFYQNVSTMNVGEQPQYQQIKIIPSQTTELNTQLIQQVPMNYQTSETVPSLETKQFVDLYPSQTENKIVYTNQLQELQGQQIMSNKLYQLPVQTAQEAKSYKVQYINEPPVQANYSQMYSQIKPMQVPISNISYVNQQPVQTLTHVQGPKELTTAINQEVKNLNEVIQPQYVLQQKMIQDKQDKVVLEKPTQMGQQTVRVAYQPDTYGFTNYDQGKIVYKGQLPVMSQPGVVYDSASKQYIQQQSQFQQFGVLPQPQIVQGSQPMVQKKIQYFQQQESVPSNDQVQQKITSNIIRGEQHVTIQQQQQQLQVQIPQQKPVEIEAEKGQLKSALLFKNPVQYQQQYQQYLQSNYTKADELQTEKPVQGGQQGGEISDLDKKIDEVLNKTKTTLQRIENKQVK